MREERSTYSQEFKIKALN